MLATVEQIADILVCPRCRGRVDTCEEGLVCVSSQCPLGHEHFLAVAGQPAMIDFGASVLNRSAFMGVTGESYKDRTRGWLAELIFRALYGTNRVAEATVPAFLRSLVELRKMPRLLIIGGGAVGSGAKDLYTDPHVTVIGTDIYPSSATTLVADAHQLPFEDASVDGVWIQAVLEHVLEPQQVVAEIYRVLRPHGLVFADTPFMQQVHEGAYDFTRYTLSGHRWLFRHFELIDFGVSGGPGTAALWTIRYFVRALTGSGPIGTLAQIPFFWLRFFDRIVRGRTVADAASGVAFFGRKSETAISPHDAIAFYDMQTQARCHMQK